MKVYAAPSEIAKPDFVFKDGRFDMAGTEASERAYIEAIKGWITKYGDPHKLNGKVVAVPYADGAAQYVVGKINGKVSLIHLEVGDAWADPRFERLATVAELTRMEDVRWSL